MTAQRIMIVVTHLLGSGHLSRALTLGRAFAAEGHSVSLASGGMPAPQLSTEDIAFTQLDPLRSDGTNFAKLLTSEGNEATAATYGARAEQLISLFREIRPHVLITELFPFGRRNLREEFLELLNAAHQLDNRPKIFASVRDILAPPSKPSKAAFAHDMIDRYYDGVLVHSDPKITPLHLSWPVPGTGTLRDKLAYTGFVAPSLPDPGTGQDGLDEILVSAGGGSVGDALFQAALGAAEGDERNWRMLVGGHDASARIDQLRRNAPSNFCVEPTRPDFRKLLQRAAASISLCGYNTAMDVLQAGLPAVMVSFDDGDELEQTLRAKALARLDGIQTLALSQINGPALHRALADALAAPKRTSTGFAFDGAARTVRICVGGEHGLH